MERAASRAAEPNRFTVRRLETLPYRRQFAEANARAHSEVPKAINESPLLVGKLLVFSVLLSASVTAARLSSHLSHLGALVAFSGATNITLPNSAMLVIILSCLTRSCHSRSCVVVAIERFVNVLPDMLHVTCRPKVTCHVNATCISSVTCCCAL